LTKSSPQNKKTPDADTSALERQIDQMVYKLYDLTPEEIAIVEGRSNNGIKHGRLRISNWRSSNSCRVRFCGGV